MLSAARCLKVSDVDFAASCSRCSTVWRRRQFSHLKSSMNSVLKMPSKQDVNEVELTCGTLRVSVQKVSSRGLVV